MPGARKDTKSSGSGRGKRVEASATTTSSGNPHSTRSSASKKLKVGTIQYDTEEEEAVKKFETIHSDDSVRSGKGDSDYEADSFLVESEGDEDEDEEGDGKMPELELPSTTTAAGSTQQQQQQQQQPWNPFQRQTFGVRKMKTASSVTLWTMNVRVARISLQSKLRMHGVVAR